MEGTGVEWRGGEGRGGEGRAGQGARLLRWTFTGRDFIPLNTPVELAYSDCRLFPYTFCVSTPTERRSATSVFLLSSLPSLFSSLPSLNPSLSSSMP